jgi:glutamate-1-semialdehyde 2,1-aminomutase
VAEIVGSALAEAGPAPRAGRGQPVQHLLPRRPVTDYSTAREQDTTAFARFFHAMLDNGVWLPPSAFEAWFVSTALTDDDLERIAGAAHSAARATGQR